MRVEFKDDDLRQLYTDPAFRIPRYGPDVTTQFRKKVTILCQARDVRDLYALVGLHFEKLRGQREGQHSVRLNKRWRLLFELLEEAPDTYVLVVDIDDYH